MRFFEQNPEIARLATEAAFPGRVLYWHGNADLFGRMRGGRVGGLFIGDTHYFGYPRSLRRIIENKKNNHETSHDATQKLTNFYSWFERELFKRTILQVGDTLAEDPEFDGSDASWHQVYRELRGRHNTATRLIFNRIVNGDRGPQLLEEILDGVDSSLLTKSATKYAADADAVDATTGKRKGTDHEDDNTKHARLHLERLDFKQELMQLLRNGLSRM